MTFPKLMLALLLLLPSSTLLSNSIEDLEYLTEQYAPFNFLDPSGVQQGYAYELLQEIWYELEIPSKQVQVLPWDKAYTKAQQDKNTVLFSASRISSREKEFKWVCSIIDINVVLLGLKENQFKIRTMPEARGYKIVVVKSDVGERLLIENSFNDKRIFRVDKIEVALKVVLLGAADLISTTELNAYQTLREIGYEPSDFEVLWVLKSTPICYAFNLKVSNRVINNFQQALERVQKNKTLIDQLKHKYDLGNN